MPRNRNKFKGLKKAQPEQLDLEHISNTEPVATESKPQQQWTDLFKQPTTKPAEASATVTENKPTTPRSPNLSALFQPAPEPAPMPAAAPVPEASDASATTDERYWFNPTRLLW